MARRDFTVNAMARRLETGELVDPFGGRDDLERGSLRTVSAESFARGSAADPARPATRLAARLRARRRDARADARGGRPGCATSRPSGSAAGQKADGMGELSKLLLGRRPALALRLARDTGALVEVVPEYGAAIGYELGTDAPAAPARRAPLRRRAGSGRRRRADSRCGSPRCSTTSGSPRPTGPAGGTPASAPSSPAGSCAACGTRTPSATRSAGSSRATRSTSTGRSTASSRGGSSPLTGSTLSRELVVAQARRPGGEAGRGLGARAPRRSWTPRSRRSATRLIGSPTSPSTGTR